MTNLIRFAWGLAFTTGLLAVAEGLPQKADTGATFYVSPQGQDRWSGRIANPLADGTDGPLATLAGARDAVRRRKAQSGLPSGGLTIRIAAGLYELDDTLTLDAADSGQSNAPVVYRNAGDGEVRISGGRRLGALKPVTDKAVLGRLDPSVRSTIRMADLKGAGITNYGQRMRQSGCDMKLVAQGMEVFFNRRPMTLARWPNGDWARIRDVPQALVEKPYWIPTKPEVEMEEGKVNPDIDDLFPDAPGMTSAPAKPPSDKGWKLMPARYKSIPGKFIFDGDRPARWQGLQDVWVHGFWIFDWGDSYEKVVSIDPTNRIITTALPFPGFPDACSPGRRWYALNILEELDQPGEYYIDRSAGKLYFWPPEGQGETVVSTIGGPLVALTNAAYITFRGLTFEGTQAEGLVIRGSRHTRVTGCVFRNIGLIAAQLAGGRDNGVTSCDIYDCGAGGIRLEDGDRLSLTPGASFAVNNDIRDYCRIEPICRPGILLGGVSNRVAHNFIHESPHLAIWVAGNDHVIEYNRIERVCLDTIDAGAVYLGGTDVTDMGHSIRWNHFSKLGGLMSPFGFQGVMAVYLDGYTAGGVDVVGNVMVNVPIGVFHGGGRDVSIANNVMVGGGAGVIAGARGLGYKVQFSTATNSLMMRQLKAINYEQPPWSVRYPMLTRLPNDQPGAPLRTRLERNIVVCDTNQALQVSAREMIRVADNLVVGTNDMNAISLFVDAPAGNYQLRDDSPAWKLGFQRIPMDKIGLYKDDDRAALPIP